MGDSNENRRCEGSGKRLYYLCNHTASSRGSCPAYPRPSGSVLRSEGHVCASVNTTGRHVIGRLRPSWLCSTEAAGEWAWEETTRRCLVIPTVRRSPCLRTLWFRLRVPLALPRVSSGRTFFRDTLVSVSCSTQVPARGTCAPHGHVQISFNIFPKDSD